MPGHKPCPSVPPDGEYVHHVRAIDVLFHLPFGLGCPRSWSSYPASSGTFGIDFPGVRYHGRPVLLPTGLPFPVVVLPTVRLPRVRPPSCTCFPRTPRRHPRRLEPTLFHRKVLSRFPILNVPSPRPSLNGFVLLPPHACVDFLLLVLPRFGSP